MHSAVKAPWRHSSENPLSETLHPSWALLPEEVVEHLVAVAWKRGVWGATELAIFAATHRASRNLVCRFAPVVLQTIDERTLNTLATRWVGLSLVSWFRVLEVTCESNTDALMQVLPSRFSSAAQAARLCTFLTTFRNAYNAWTATQLLKTLEQSVLDMYLRLMAHWGLYEGVLMLLDAKADPNAKDADDDGHTAMHKTAWCNDPLVVDIIEALVKAGGDVNVLDKRRRMPMYYAAMFSRFVAMRTLLKKGANIDGGTTVDTSPLRCAASEGNCEVVKFLHEEGASFGPGIVHHVAGSSFMDTGDVMRYVLKHSGQEIDLLDMNDHTPLQVALQICNDGNVHALLDAGAERVKPAGDVDDKLLHVVRFGQRGCVNIVRYLVDAGCDVNGCDRAGCPTVFHAVAQNDIEVVRLLVELGADFNKSDKYDMSPLAKAIRNQNNAMVSFLLDQGANVHEIDDEGRSLVHHAVSVNAQYILDLLLMRGVDPNIVSQDGMTALHYAVHDGNEACVRTLLFYGAEPNAKDKFGLHPLNWAIKCSATDRFDLTYHRQRMFAIIEEAGGTFAPGTSESTMFKYNEL